MTSVSFILQHNKHSWTKSAFKLLPNSTYPSLPPFFILVMPVRMNGVGVSIGVRARSDLGGRRPVCPKKLRSAPLLDCRNQLFTPSKCTKKHAFTIVERHKIVRNRNTVFRTSHTLCRFTRSSNDRVTKQATRCSKCQRSTEQQQSIKCFKIHSKDLLQNNDFHITSSIFLLSSVLVFYFFLILFFNSIVYRFFIARIFGVLPEYFRDWGGCCPPPPPPWLVRLWVLE